MKKVFFILFIVSTFQNQIFCQTPCSNYCLGFDYQYCMDQFDIDTAVQNNIWQIGVPQKTVFTDAYYGYNVVITDTINPYPINNESIIIVTNPATYGDIYGISTFSGYYFVNTDTLKDFGKIEMSFDDGITWINIIEDTTYNCFLWSFKPTLTGNSNTWQYFEAYFTDLGSVFNLEFDDPILYKFSFFSDSIFDNKDGIMYDEICFSGFIEGISETHFTPIKSTVFPNPSIDKVTIEFENPLSDAFEVSVYNIKSVPVIKKENVTDNFYLINTKELKPGTFIYKITNLKDKKRCWGKFVIQ